MINFPIFVYEHGDISTYDKIEDLESDLEVIDVENNEFIVYDCEAMVLELDIVSSCGKQEKIQIREPDKPIYRNKEFRRTLEQFVSSCENTDVNALSNMSLKELISRVKYWSS